MINQILQPKKENEWRKKIIIKQPIAIFVTLVLFLFIINALNNEKDNSLQEEQTTEQQITEKQTTENQQQETEQKQNERFEQDKEAIRSFYREIVVYDTKVANYFTTAREKISQTPDYLLYQALITAKQNMDQYAIAIGFTEIPDIYDKDDQKQLKSAISSLALTYGGRSGYFGYYAKALDETTNAGVQKKKDQAIALGEQAHEFEIEAIEKLVEILDKYDLTDEY